MSICAKCGRVSEQWVAYSEQAGQDLCFDCRPETPGGADPEADPTASTATAVEDGAVKESRATVEFPQASTLTDFTEVVAKPVRWAWGQRIAQGKITGLAGRPKIGKGLLYSELIAGLRGASWRVTSTARATRSSSPPRTSRGTR